MYGVESLYGRIKKGLRRVPQLRGSDIQIDLERRTHWKASVKTCPFCGYDSVWNDREGEAVEGSHIKEAPCPECGKMVETLFTRWERKVIRIHDTE